MARAGEIAATIAGPQTSVRQREAALEIGEAQAYVELVRLTHERLLHDHVADIAEAFDQTEQNENAVVAYLEIGGGGPAEWLASLLEDVRVLPRYDRRARSRRKSAMKAYERAARDQRNP